MTPPIAIRAAIFDIGMVLLRFDFSMTVEKIRGRCSVGADQIPLMLWGSGLVDAYDRGLIDTEEFACKASTVIGFQGTGTEFISHWTDIFTPVDQMIARAHRWKERGMPLYLLSNTCESHIEFFTSRYDVFGIFDGAVYSCRGGLMKPEKQIYEKLLREYSLEPSTTVFIDDREENVSAAKELGICAIRYEDEPKLIAALQGIGLD